MKFRVEYIVGKELRSKNIFAKDLDEASLIADKKFSKWESIIILTKEK
jgi:hypothetical protein